MYIGTGRCNNLPVPIYCFKGISMSNVDLGLQYSMNWCIFASQSSFKA